MASIYVKMKDGTTKSFPHEAVILKLSDMRVNLQSLMMNGIVKRPFLRMTLQR